MKYGLLSDSAGDIDALATAVDLLLGKGAERIAFLGGYWTDLDMVFQRRRVMLRGREEYTDNDFLADVAGFMAKRELELKGAAAKAAAPKDEMDRFMGRFVRVPDRESLQYRDPNIPIKLPELVGSVICCLVHDKADLVKEDVANAALLIHGRGKAPGVVQIGPRFFVTPGRLSGVDCPTCALIDTSQTGTSFVAFDLSAKQVHEYVFPTERKTKASAK
jgi:hypothetical protein